MAEIALPTPHRFVLLLAIGAANLRLGQRRFLFAARRTFASDCHQQAAFQVKLRLMDRVFRVMSLLLPMGGPIVFDPVRRAMDLAVERIETATTLEIRRIKNKWAGLRSFVSDKNLVVGHDPRIEGFFWLAGQGGYGIQTAAAAGRLATALALGKGLPGDIAELGVSEAALSPARFTPQ